jgi:hypothetical protein
MKDKLEQVVDSIVSLITDADDIPTSPPIVERSTKPESTQPRLNKGYNIPSGWWVSYDITAAKLPIYAANSRMRDQVLHHIWRAEPHLAGIVNAVVLIDSNRGWSLTGGRNQVNRFTKMLHDADGGQGWRTYMRKSSLSYWTTDLGMVTELGREGKGGPVRAIYHTDSTRCQLVNGPNQDLNYYPSTGVGQVWTAADYFRICSMPSDDELFGGLGYCSISRAIEITRILYAVMIHDQEQVGARAPKGLLLLSNISEEQWEQSLATREEKLDSLEYRYYGGVQVLASSGMGNPDAKLVALSQLPANFDAKTFYDLCMYSYASCFGFDPSEFWPVQFGSMGRGTETEVQHMKATGKGGTEFALAYAEQLQRVLPDTLAFEFEQRDDQGAIAEANVNAAKSAWVMNLYNAGLMQGAPLVSRDEARQLLADNDLIPSEWTLTPDEATSTDTEEERMLDTVQVRRAIAQFPYEPIIRMTWKPGKQIKMRVIYDPIRRKRTFAKGTRRATDDILYEKGDVTITEGDVDDAIEDARQTVGDEFASLLVAPAYKAK